MFSKCVRFNNEAVKIAELEFLFYAILLKVCDILTGLLKQKSVEESN
jgi:hypothetical protein